MVRINNQRLQRFFVKNTKIVFGIGRPQNAEPLQQQSSGVNRIPVNTYGEGREGQEGGDSREGGEGREGQERREGREGGNPQGRQPLAHEISDSSDSDSKESLELRTPNSANDDELPDMQNPEASPRPGPSNESRPIGNNIPGNRKYNFLPFKKETRLITDKISGVNILMANVSHKREKAFAQDDHMYRIRFDPIPGRTAPLLSSVITAFRKAILSAVRQLKVYYGSSENLQVWYTICDRDIFNGLNTGHYSIHTPAYVIANHLIDMLSIYLVSHRSKKLNSSFNLKAKVLTEPHLLHKERTSDFVRKTYVNEKYGTSEVVNLRNEPHYVINPKYHANYPHFFGTCLWMCLILAFYWHLKIAQNTPDLNMFWKKIKEVRDGTNVEAFKLMSYEFNALRIRLGIYPFANASLNDVELIIKDWRLQVHVFDENGHYKVSVPEVLNFSLKQVYLMEKKPDKETKSI